MPRQLPFGLTKQPFLHPASREQVFLGMAAVEWVSALVDAVLDGRRVVRQSGEPGAGKTVLLDVAVEELRLRGIDVIRAAAPLPGPLGLQRMIGNAAGVHRSEAMEPGMLVQAIGATGRMAPIVLLVDDAHTLANASLRYLWLMSSLLGFSGVKLQLVLVGQPDLDAMLLNPEFAQIRLAVGAKQVLHALDDNEAMAYLDHKLRAAGSSLRQVMTKSAVDAVLRRSAGLPGHIDFLAGHALASGPQFGQRRISHQAVAAASDGVAIANIGLAARSGKLLVGAAGGLAVAALAVFLFMPRQPALMTPTLLRPQAAAVASEALSTLEPVAPEDGPKEAASTPAAPGTVIETIGVTPPLQADQPKPPSPEAEPFPVRTVQTGETQTGPVQTAAAQSGAPRTGEAQMAEVQTGEAQRAAVHVSNMASLAEPRPPSFAAGLLSAGKGLVLLAKAGDSVPSLYRQVYRGVTPPPYAEVAAANPPVLRPGDLLVFPAPPNGWRN